MPELEQLLKGELPPGPFHFVLNDEQLTELANRFAGEQPDLGLVDLAVHATAGGIEAAARAKLGVLPLAVKLAASVALAADRLAFEITSLEINRTQAPGFIRNQIVAAIEERLDPEQWPVVVESLALREGELEVSGIVK